MKPHRVRWFSASIEPSTLDRIVERMRSDEYSSERMSGFRLSEVRKNYTEGVYIEKKLFEDIVRDPDGNPIKQPRIEFNQIHFRIAAKSPQLEIRNPPRSCKALIMRIAEYSNYTISIGNIAIPLELWLSALTMRLSSLSVLSLEIDDLRLDDNIVAKLWISGLKDVRHSSLAVVGNRAQTVRRIGFFGVDPKTDHPLAGDILQNGAVVIRQGRIEQVLPIMRETLCEALASYTEKAVEIALG